ncbi:MAG: tetratricopeptide repeat protein [Burkholderiaceae bacterium]
MKLKTTASLLVLAGLMGCSSLVPATREMPAVRFGTNPVVTTQNSASEGMYAMARLAHDQGQLATAAQRYRRTLEMKPDHVGALNGLGVILAQDGRTAEALELLARARDLAPGAGHIHNNLGYALLREQRLDEAQSALQTAQELQPGSQQTQRNLRLLDKARQRMLARADKPASGAEPSASLARVEPAPPVQIVPVAPQVFELRLATALGSLSASVAAATPAPTPLPAPQRLPEPPVVVATASTPARIVPSQEPGVMVLQVPDSQPQTAKMVPVPTPVADGAAVRVAAVPMPASATEVVRLEPMPQPEPGYRLVLSRELGLQQGPFAIWTDIRGVKLEIANGVGVERLARRTADRLAREGVVTARLTNAKPYRQERTQIEYAPGQHDAVQALAARLPVPVALVPVAELERDMSLRLVLGQDAVGRTLASWLDGDAPQFAAAEAPTDSAS